MNRVVVMVCGIGWLAGIGACDLWVASRSSFVRAQLDAAIEDAFISEVRFGTISYGLGQDFVIRDLRVMRPDRPTEVYGGAESIGVALDWSALFSRRVVIDSVDVVHPFAAVSFLPDGEIDAPSPLRPSDGPSKPLELPPIHVSGLAIDLKNAPWLDRPQTHVRLDSLALDVSQISGSIRCVARVRDDPLFGNLDVDGAIGKPSTTITVKHDGQLPMLRIAELLKPDLRSALSDVEFSGGFEATVTVGESTTARLVIRDAAASYGRVGQHVSALSADASFEGQVITVAALGCDVEGGRLEAKGRVDLRDGADPIIDLSGSLAHLPLTPKLGEHVAKWPKPGPTIGEQIISWDPKGTTDITFKVRQIREKDGTPGDIRPFLDVAFNGGTSVRFLGSVGSDGKRHGFPYRIESVRGVLHFDDLRMHFDDVTASNGPLAVRAGGKIGYEKAGDETYDVKIRAEGMPLDDQLRDALEEEGRNLLESLSAKGSVDVDIFVKRAADELPGARVEAVADMKGLSARPTQFPADIHDIRGVARIGDLGIELKDVSGKYVDSVVTLNGRVGTGDRSHELKLRFETDSLAVDAGFLDALETPAPNTAPKIRGLHPEGAVGGWVTLERGKGDTVVKAGLKLLGNAMLIDSPRLPFSNIKGTLDLEGDTITIGEGTTFVFGGAELSGQGTVSDGSTLDLVVQSPKVEVFPTLQDALAVLVPAFSEPNRPEIGGPLALRVAITGKPEAGALHWTAILQPDGLALNADRLPPLEEIRGEIKITDGSHVEGRDLAATALLGGGRRVSLRVATGEWRTEAATSGADERLVLNAVNVSGLPLGKALIDALPIEEATRKKLENLELSGDADLGAGRIAVGTEGVRATKIQLAGHGVGLGAKRDVYAEELNTERTSLVYKNGGLSIEGWFGVNLAVIHKVAFPQLRGTVFVDDQRLRLENIRGVVFGYEDVRKQGSQEVVRRPAGRLEGDTNRFEIRFADSAFDSSAVLTEVQLSPTIRSFGHDPGKVSGPVAARLDVSGRLDDPATWTGKGGLNANTNGIVELPLFAKIFRVLDVESIFKKSDPWTKIEMDIVILNKQLQLPRLILDAPDVKLTGTGHLGFNGHLHADLSASHRVGFTPLDWIGAAISSVAVSSVTVDGPIGDPAVNTGSIVGK